MSRNHKNNELLVEEFHVQVFSNGRIDWDNLDSYIPPRELKPSALLNRLKQRLEPTSSR